LSEDKDRELAERSPSLDSDVAEHPGDGSDETDLSEADGPQATVKPPPVAAALQPEPTLSTNTSAPAYAQAPPVMPAPAPRSSAAPIAWLALLLVLLLSAGGFWFFLDAQRREGDLLQRVRALESVSGQDDSAYTQMRDNLRRQIELEIEGMRDRQQRAQEDFSRAQQTQQRAQEEQQRSIARLESVAMDAANKASGDLSAEIATLERSLQEQGQRIADLSVDDRESWLLAEAQYLLRLANQRLIMTGDTESAEALLRSTDNILRELANADLHGLRSAVAADLAVVRAVPRLDIQGLYLRLDALIRQTDALVMFRMPERTRETAAVTGDDWRTRLEQGYQSALAKLSEYIVVSRRDVPVETLMDPQYEGLVRQNMRMLLEQAQVAMLSGNELLFRQSLERAQGWVSQFFKSDEQAAVAMAEELRVIAGERVAVELPDLTASLGALDAVMKTRLARDGN
jgi:uroporphyrin-3 C-methyltransferase